MMPFILRRDAFGKLICEIDGQVHEGVVPVRAFPIAAPEEGIALVGAEGHELVWLERLEEVSLDAQQLIREELASREFLPEISRIKHVSAFATPSTWQVATDRGDATLILKGEEDIRRIGDVSLLIADAHGVQYLIRDLHKLDKPSRKMLDRFL
ncbi:DUF1854 domain-containing protein [uncultured Oxalicibacterium sp.]|uniref:cyanophycin metabolism-associated DUF1854 family protein n=1 Tax=uncultured Oxalicibacterium sp. TaxID=1168540 RepID=UPI0025F1D549|nr:DUF1854 domain-containing protein [uncultured Oxalicibacterium sp.]